MYVIKHTHTPLNSLSPLRRARLPTVNARLCSAVYSVCTEYTKHREQQKGKYAVVDRSVSTDTADLSLSQQLSYSE